MKGNENITVKREKGCFSPGCFHCALPALLIFTAEKKINLTRISRNSHSGTDCGELFTP
jgi:hypothetical protein